LLADRLKMDGHMKQDNPKDGKDENIQTIINKVLTKRLSRERQLIAAKLGLSSIDNLDVFLHKVQTLELESIKIKQQLANAHVELQEKELMILALLKGVTVKHLQAFTKLALLEVQKNKSVDDSVDHVLKNFSFFVDHQGMQEQQNEIIEKEKGKMKEKIAKINVTINKMKEPFRTIGLKVYDVVVEEAPELIVDLWYGSVAFKDPITKKVICFFRLDMHFTFGLGEDAHFDFTKNKASVIQPSAWFLSDFNNESETLIRQIVRSATHK
jgi:hypothetical protein